MPKAGGTSFRKLLRNHFSYRLHSDYGDMPLNTPIAERQQRVEGAKSYVQKYGQYIHRLTGVRCIHGHFLAHKYSFYAHENGSQFVTWLRDPIERLGSHYYFWKRTPRREVRGALHRRFMREDWTLKQFCFAPELKNVYQQFLWKFPIEKFSFIGIMEQYEEDLAYFAQEYLGTSEVNLPSVNRNPDQPISYFKEQSMVKDLRAFHAEDVQIYDYALKRRLSRMSPNLSSQ